MTITLKTLSTATEQEIFNQVATHLLTQMEVSQDKNSMSCLYRGPNGLKCAAGCLIADDEYLPEMEGEAWASMSYDGIVPEEHKSLIDNLQIIHDCERIGRWLWALTSLAEKCKLDTTILNSFRK